MATDEQVEFYDNFLEHFVSQVNNTRNVGFRQLTRMAVRELCAMPLRVLDIGCSFGYNSEYLHREFPGCEIHGIDISPRCIAYAKEQFPHGHWFCGDVTERDPRRDIQLVLMSDVIEHIPLERHPVFFKTLESITLPGCVLVMSLPVPEADTEQTFQPVEEKIFFHDVLGYLCDSGFNLVHYVDRPVPYQRLIVQKGEQS